MNWQEYNKQYPVDKFLSLPKFYYQVYDNRYDAEKYVLDLINDEYCIKSTVVEFDHRFYVIPA